MSDTNQTNNSLPQESPYEMLARQVERQKRMPWLGPLITFAFAFYVVGFSFTVPYILFLNRRLFALAFALILSIVYLFYNLNEIRKDEAALAEYERTNVIPDRLITRKYYRSTQLFSFVVVVLVMLGARLIQSPSPITSDVARAETGLNFNTEEVFGRQPDFINLNQIKGFIVPKQYHGEWGIVKEGKPVVPVGESQPEDWDQLVSFDLYGMRSEAMAKSLYKQLDMRAIKSAKDMNPLILIREYSDYETETVPQNASVKVQIVNQETSQIPAYNFLMQYGKDVMAGSYYGPLDFDEVLPYFLSLFNR